ncbi:hypothetical protein ACOSP7_010505 [Xanthoceras sorbifolium]
MHPGTTRHVFWVQSHSIWRVGCFFFLDLQTVAYRSAIIVQHCACKWYPIYSFDLLTILDLAYSSSFCVYLVHKDFTNCLILKLYHLQHVIIIGCTALHCGGPLFYMIAFFIYNNIVAFFSMQVSEREREDNDVVVFEPNPGRRKRSKQGGQYMMSKAIRRSIQEWENENDKEDNDRVGSSAEDRSKAAFASDNLPVLGRLIFPTELMSDLEDLLLFNDIGLNSVLTQCYMNHDPDKTI